MTVKESFNVAGLPTTWGFPRGKDWRPPEDALIVARAKAAGAIVLGKTNVPVALADWQSYNDIYGTTNNPVGPRPHAGRLVRRLGGVAGGRLRPPGARVGYRRLAARARALLRRLRAQADAGAGAEPRANAARSAGAADSMSTWRWSGRWRAAPATSACCST